MTIYVSIIVTEEKNEKVRTCRYSLQLCQGLRTRYTYVVQIDVQVDTMETCKRWSILNQLKILHRRYRTVEINLEIENSTFLPN